MKTISIRELHAKTGSWVRTAAVRDGVTITDRGRAVARLVPVREPSEENRFTSRKLRPGFKRLLSRSMSTRDSAELISQDRDRR